MRVWSALIVSGWLLGCAGPLMIPEEGEPARLRHRDLGYRIGAPRVASWELIEVDRADIAYSDTKLGGVFISLSSSCPKTRARGRALSRQLALGTDPSDRVASGPVTLGSAEGWTQTFDTGDEAASVRVKTVTLASAGCIYDWVLAANTPEAFARVEPDFDAWWGSFEPPIPEAGAGEGPSSEPEPEGGPS